ncbi:MAG: hypothetical protein RI893_1597, partial [Pseudomonadota bacterium]
MLIIQGKISHKVILLLPLILAFGAISAIYWYSYINSIITHTKGQVNDSFLLAQRVFSVNISSHTDKLSATLTAMAQDERLKSAMLAGNRSDLLLRANAIFESLAKDYNITHFYFIHPDHRVFLRVHQPERYGDVIDRFTLKQAEATGKLASGLELGPLGTFTLRTVVPWHDGDRLIGYLELGEELGTMLKSISDSLEMNAFLTVKKQYLSQSNWQQGAAMLNRPWTWDFLPDSVLVFQTLPTIFPELQQALAKDNHAHTQLADQNKKFMFGQISLLDAGGREVGKVVFLHDVTRLSDQKKRDIIWSAGIALGFSGGVIWFFYYVIGRIKKRLTLSQTAIQNSNALLCRSIDNARDAIITINGENGEIAAWNVAAELMFGYSKEEAIKQTLHEIITPIRFQSAAKKGMSHFATTGEGEVIGKTQELSAMHKNGTEFPIELSVSITQINGKWLATGIVRDITERKQHELALATVQHDLKIAYELILLKNKQLYKSNRARSEFLAAISHELKTPLNTIIGFSELLKEGITGALTEEQSDFTRGIYEAGIKLLSLLSDIIDFARLEAGHTYLELRQVQADVWLTEIMMPWQERATASGLTFLLDIPKPLGILYLDPAKARQIVVS